MNTLTALTLGLTLAVASPRSASPQAIAGPDTVTVVSGALRLRGLLWRPEGRGPFPGILFNHGSSSAADTSDDRDPFILGPVFARRGYVFLFLFRRGIGLSRGQGAADGDLMSRAFETGGNAARNRVQLQLLDGEELNEITAGLAMLRTLPNVDQKRVAVIGHSFGASLTLVLAARDTTIRAAVAFAPAAASWERSPQLRTRLLDAVNHTKAPVLLIFARNDYSIAPGTTLAEAMQHAGKPHELKMYPAVGRTASDGHSLIYTNVPDWEPDVFRFLKARLP